MMNFASHSFPRRRCRAALLVGLCVATVLSSGVAGVAGVTAVAATAAGPPADVVLTMSSGGGFVPIFSDFRTPPLHVVTTGRVHYRPSNDTDSNDLVSRVVSDQMSTNDLATLDSLAKSAGLKQRIDWGLPNTADVPALTITYRGRTQSIPSYGVGEQSLTKKQQSARRKVAKLIDFLENRSRARSKVVQPTALVVATVEAQDVPSGGKKALTGSVALPSPVITVQDWPSSAPALKTIGNCAVVTDPAAVTALSTVPLTVRFRSDNKVWQVFARIKLPGDSGCTP
jgi:hypothetical protein